MPQLLCKADRRLQAFQAAEDCDCNPLLHKQGSWYTVRYLVPLTQGHSVACNGQLLCCHDCHEIPCAHKLVTCTQFQHDDLDWLR